jgi:hypothetical protein
LVERQITLNKGVLIGLQENFLQKPEVFSRSSKKEQAKQIGLM